MAMRIVVKKFGGSSLSTSGAIRRIARMAVAEKRQGCGVVVVVSAQGDTTDRLLELAAEMGGDPNRRELDRLLATGEQAASALVAMAIWQLGEPAISFSGAQCGILTNPVHGNSRILEVWPGRIREELERERIVVAAGFQGVSREGEVTTLGRGGSDNTAVALAAALGAEYCENFTDVDGVYTADPRAVSGARRLEELTYAEMQELAWQGARVLKAEAVELARDNDVEIRVASSSAEESGALSRGTIVRQPVFESSEGGFEPRRGAVAGVTGRHDLLRFDVAAGRFAAERYAQLIHALARYDLVFCGVAGGRERLYLSTEEMVNPTRLSSEIRDRFAPVVEVTAALGAVSLVGFGLGSRPVSLLEMQRVLRHADIEVDEIWSGRESITAVVQEARVDAGVAALHQQLVEKQPTGEEAGDRPLAGDRWEAAG